MFQSSDRKLIEGVYSYDIVNGIGVCLNISSMLTDYLNFVGYSSATLINHISGSKPNYLINMERQKGKENFRTKALSVILKPISKNAYNHAFNLIDDKNKLYIYDATNFLIFNIETKYSATALKADINAKLNPYLSYMLNLDEKSIQVLDKINLLENNENFEMENFDSLLNNDIDFFRDNDTLFNEFYYDVKPDIDQISKVINNSKQLKKDIRKSLYIYSLFPFFITY